MWTLAWQAQGTAFRACSALSSYQEGCIARKRPIDGDLSARWLVVKVSAKVGQTLAGFVTVKS